MSCTCMTRSTSRPGSSLSAAAFCTPRWSSPSTWPSSPIPGAPWLWSNASSTDRSAVSCAGPPKPSSTSTRRSVTASCPGGHHPQNLRPLPNGVDLDAFLPPASTEERIALRRQFNLPLESPLVLFVGRLVHKKGYRQLVDAAERQRSWIAVLVGDGDSVSRSAQVLPCGVQDRESVRLLYRACDVFALPSRSEGFPLTVQEAMASRLSIMHHQWSGIRHVRSRSHLGDSSPARHTEPG